MVRLGLGMRRELGLGLRLGLWVGLGSMLGLGLGLGVMARPVGNKTGARAKVRARIGWKEGERGEVKNNLA